MDTAFAADGEDGHDVGVVQLGGGLGFVLEAQEPLGIQGRGVGQDFQGDAAVEGNLRGFVDDAHAAAAEFAEDLKIAQGAEGG